MGATESDCQVYLSSCRAIADDNVRGSAILDIAGVTVNETYGGQRGTGGLVLERGLIHAERVVLRLGRDRRGRRVVVWGSTITARIAVEVVSIMKTLVRCS